MGVCAALFYSSNDSVRTLHSRITPNTEQREYFQECWRKLADHLVSYLNDLTDLPISTWIQGSYKMGTQVRPVTLYDEIDIDLGVYFEWEGQEPDDPTPEDLREAVQDALIDYQHRESEAKEVAAPPKERCCRIFYRNHFYIDVPVYHLDRPKDQRRLATESHGWEHSDPKALVVWFQNKVGQPERHQLRRVVRYLKIYSAIISKDHNTVPPSSILLTVLATESWLSLNHDKISGDDECLHLIVERILERLRKNKIIPNPVDKKENLNRLDETDFALFLRALEYFLSKSKEAVSSDNEYVAAILWSEIFQHFFPMPHDLNIDEVVSLPAVVPPEVGIDVTVEKTGRRVGSYKNNLPNLYKGCLLNFRITNPETISTDADVEWVVRNDGKEAEGTNDLGHHSRAVYQLTAEERTRYHGDHVMDCIVRQNGKIVSARRILVHIQRSWFPTRNQARPAWVKFRKKKR